MKRTLIAWLLLTSVAVAQETISDQPTIAAGSLLTPSNVYTIVDDQNLNPAATRKVDLSAIAALGHTYITPVTDLNLTGSEPFLIAVNSTDVAHEITVPDSMSCVIVNVSDNSANLNVNMNTQDVQVLEPGEYLWVMWNGVDTHHLAIQPGLTVDVAMSAVSSNPVRNSVIKAYVDAAIPTIDSTVSTGSNNAVRNSSITNYVNARGMVRAGDVVVVGSGNAATDATALAAAVTALNTQGYGTLWIDGTVRVNAVHQFTAPISVRGVSRTANLHITDALAGIQWGPPETTTFDPKITGAVTGSAAGVDFTATSAFQSRVQSENLELEEGDWFLIWSEDELSGMSKNATFQKPAELHQVFRRDNATVTVNTGTDEFTETVSGGKTTTTFGDMRNGWPVKFFTTGTLPAPLIAGTRYYVVNYDNAKSWQVADTPGGAFKDITTTGTGTLTVVSDTYVLGDHVIDAMTSSQKIRRIPMLSQPNSANTSDVYVGDFRLSQEPGIHDNQLFQFYFLNGLTVANIHYQFDNGFGGPGSLRFNYCGNVVVDHFVCDAVEDYDTLTGGSSSGSLYLIQMQIVNGMTVQNSHFRRTRHAVDCSNGFQDAGGTTRYGTPLGVLVQGCVFTHESHADGGLTPISNHGEGWGTVFANNLIKLGSVSHSTYAAQIRARATRFTGNTIYGTNVAKGVLALADDVEISHNRFVDCWKAIEADYQADGFDRTVISHNVFDNCGGTGTDDVAVVAKAGDDVVISHNVFANSPGGNLRVSHPGTSGLISHNTFTNMGSGGSEACIAFSGTGSNSPENWTISYNVFHEIPEICISYEGGASGVGDGQKILHNEFINCTPTSLIVFADDGSTTGHKIYHNTAWKGTNTNFVNLGSVDTAAIRFVGNAVDGYGSGDIGLTGTNAAAVNAAQAADNWTD